MCRVNRIENLALILITVALSQLNQSPVSGLAIDQRSVSSQTTDQGAKVSSGPKSSEAIAELSPVESTTTQPINQQQPEQRADKYELARQQDHRRPVWAIAHMVNSIKELNYRLDSGANAIEVDVTFGRDGTPLFTYHGPPCDCWRHCYQRENFNDYLSYIREIAIDRSDGIGKNLTLLFFDLKLDYLDQRGKINAGIELAKSILANLFTDSATNEISTINKEQQDSSTYQEQANNSASRNPFYLMVSVNHVTDGDLIRNFIHTLDVNNSSHLMRRIGFEVGMNDDIQQIEAMWRRFDGATLNLWQGDGFTNCFSPFYNLERLSKALVKRDQKLGYPAKVYHWTIDLHDRMRESLKMGVDAIMSNHPERLLSVLQEPEIAHDLRLANRHDDPFIKLNRRLVGRSGETARYQRSVRSVGGGFIGNLADVVASGIRYIREIPLLSFFTTTRIFSRSSAGGGGNSSARNSATIKSPSSSITRVSLQNQPTYKLESFANYAQSATTTTTTTTTSPIDGEKSTGSVDGANTAPPYTGPKWYTSLISNVLVSMLKVALPVQSNS